MKKADKSEVLPQMYLEQMAEAIRVLGHGQRLQIIQQLELCGEQSVTDIVEAIAGQQGAVSQHLGKMRAAGIIAARRAGRQVYYHISSASPVTILNCLRREYSKTVTKSNPRM
ncbi:MAG: helix-turn-helix transcriptional regulator [Lentisphaerae bacterium]|nr:helix-turn-helix transcriptional regulator [Lentisphaerota bacterium]